MHELPYFNRAFAQMLRDFREKARMTQMRLAIQIGGSEVAIRRLERGVQTPTTTTLILLSAALEIEPATFLNAVLERMAYLKNASESMD